MTGTIAKLKQAADILDSYKMGYDQNQRWDIRPGGECDCSSTCGTIIAMAGYPIDLKGTFYTGNFAKKAKDAGFSVVDVTTWSWTQIKAFLKNGMFLLTPGHHVEFYWEGKEFSARWDERGKSTGGQSGNQGDNVGWTTVSNRPGGWTFVIVPPNDPAMGDFIPVMPNTLLNSVRAAGLTSIAPIQDHVNGHRIDINIETLTAGLNEALKYCSNNKRAVSIFAAAMAEESEWFASTVNRADSSPYSARTFGRIFGESNYLAFGKWLKDKGLVEADNIFIKDPDFLGDIKWAWLGGVWLFEKLSLWDEAIAGDFQRVQNMINLGTSRVNVLPTGWITRLLVYRAFLSSYSKPAVLSEDGDYGPKSKKRTQEFIGAAIDGDFGEQSWFLFGVWVGLSGSFDLNNRSHVKMLQTKIGVPSTGIDGVWWMPKSKKYGPQTTEYLQKYLNRYR